MGWSLWCTLSSCWCCRVLKENIQAFFLDLHLKSRVIYDNYSPKLMAKTWKSPKQMKRNMRSSFCHIHFLGWGCVSYKPIYNFIYIYISMKRNTISAAHLFCQEHPRLPSSFSLRRKRVLLAPTPSAVFRQRAEGTAFNTASVLP